MSSGKVCVCIYVCVYIYVYSKEIYCKALIYEITKVEKSHDLPSASWRPRKDGGVTQRPRAWCKFQSESVSLRTRITEGRSVSQLRQREIFLFSFLFYSDPQQIGWCPRTIGKAICFTPSAEYNANLPETSPQTYSEIMFN